MVLKNLYLREARRKIHSTAQQSCVKPETGFGENRRSPSVIEAALCFAISHLRSHRYEEYTALTSRCSRSSWTRWLKAARNAGGLAPPFDETSWAEAKAAQPYGEHGQPCAPAPLVPALGHLDAITHPVAANLGRGCRRGVINLVNPLE